MGKTATTTSPSTLNGWVQMRCTSAVEVWGRGASLNEKVVSRTGAERVVARRLLASHAGPNGGVQFFHERVGAIEILILAMKTCIHANNYVSHD
jgi:hypothetical protein